MTKLRESNEGHRWKKKESWELWSESSIWSMVCAMELGILTESAVQNVPESSHSRKPAKRKTRKRKSRRTRFTRKYPSRKAPVARQEVYDRPKRRTEKLDVRKEAEVDNDKENVAHRSTLRRSRRLPNALSKRISESYEGEEDSKEEGSTCNDDEEILATEDTETVGNRSEINLLDSDSARTEMSLDENSTRGDIVTFEDLEEAEAGFRFLDPEEVSLDDEILRREIDDLSSHRDYDDLSTSSDRARILADNFDGFDELPIFEDRRKPEDEDGEEVDLDDVPLAQRIFAEKRADDNGNYSKYAEPASRKRRSAGRSATPGEESEQFHEVRRVTRGLTKITEETVKENFVGKLVWGSCSGWWPAIIINAEDAGMTPSPGKVWVFWVGESRISSLNEKTQVEPFSSKLRIRLEKKSDARGKCIDTAIQMLRRQLGCVLTKPYHVWLEKNLPELDRRDKLRFYPYPANIQRRLDYLKDYNKRAIEKFDSDMKRSNEMAKKHSSDKGKEIAISPDRLPLKEQRPGVITWAKIAGVNWWPAMIVDYRDCCMREPSFGCQWIMWYGDYQLSQIHHNDFMKFHEGLEKMRDYVQNTKRFSYVLGVLQASRDYCARLGYQSEKWTLADALRWSAKNVGLVVENDCKMADSKCGKYSETILRNLNDLKINQNVDNDRQRTIKGALRAVISGKHKLDSLCLMCMEVPTGGTDEHPFFVGLLCKECSEHLKPRVFVFGEDGKSYYCTVCAGFGVVVMCDRDDCPRVYCTACLKYLLCPETYNEVLLADPWECFLCKTDPGFFPGGLISPRTDWKSRLARMFRTTTVSNYCDVPPVTSPHKKRKIRVLSLFDGLSTGLVVLMKLGIVPEVYYASEIDTDALTVSSWHFGDRVIQLGDVRDINDGKLREIAPIDLIIGGSPCNDLSLVNPARLGLHDPNGTGILFFEYCRILKAMKRLNKDRHLFWMYENVASMPSKYRLEINENLGREPDLIDSADFSPQHRLRLYWHNLPVDPRSITRQSQQDVQDVLTPNCDRYALVKKIRTVTTRANSLKQGKSELKPILMRNESDNLWITELEEIFGFPRHYTDVKNMSATKRQRLIGKSWSVQTLTAVLQPLCVFFETSGSD